MASNDEIKAKIVAHAETLGKAAPDVTGASNAELTRIAKELKGEIAELGESKVVIAKAPPGVYVRKGCSITAPGNRIIGAGEPVTENDLASVHVEVLIEKKILERRQ